MEAGAAKAMNEEAWWSCENPKTMLQLLARRASKRKLRLFAAACARDLLAYRPDAAEEDGWGSLEEFKASIDRAEAYADGHGALEHFMIWVEHPDAAASAFRVVGVDTDVGASMSDPLEAIKDFRVNPAHWLRDIFGPLPFRPVASLDAKILDWNDGTVSKLAQTVYDERLLPDGTLDQQRLAVLADALEEAGCIDNFLLSHWRGPGPHVRGCWVLDAILNKA